MSRLLAQDQRSIALLDADQALEKALPEQIDLASLGGENEGFDVLHIEAVEALILAPEAGEVNLLGESFLKRLVSVEQRNGALVLRQ